MGKKMIARLNHGVIKKQGKECVEENEVFIH
jgi:hypothetical protein